MGLNTSAKKSNEGSTTHYGHMDYARDKANGMSDSAILSQIHAEPGKMGNGGVGGDLYNQIASGANSGGSSSGGGSGGGGGGGGYRPKPRPISGNLPGADRPVINDADRITIGVGKDGDMYTGIGNDNVIANSDIGNDNSETTLRMRMDAAERSQNHLDLLADFGKKGHMTTEIGDRNRIADSRIGNDNSITSAWIDFGTGLEFS
jgi:hypothetical protein